ncbi:unnamed protein product [Psylliodes chrysocephalus]|uniref:39S ribosomal protein L41, mitochondrial n=1 Tax=Psylliodes chrysocephalus TaxID=3402493 RepID=A0A9P0GH24_9CUCU|nr:unnamed protein product [Psylliodes chrysocephala]
MSLINMIIKRSIFTTARNCGKRNFRKFPLYNKRGSKVFKQQQIENPNSDIPINKRGVRDIGYQNGDKFVVIPERIPELIVPDISNCSLKPYVSYRAPDVFQSKFTEQDLFNVVYSPKIVKDFKEGKLAEDGQPLNPSENEKMSAEEAKLRAKRTGSDIF